MKNLQGLTIKKMKVCEAGQVAVLLAHGMCRNPNHLVLFGSVSDRSLYMQTQMFKMVLEDKYNTTFIAVKDGAILGSMTYTAPGYCQLQPLRLFIRLPKLISVFKFRLPAVLKWRMVWAGHDPKEPHVHFGPIVVKESWRGMGIGKALLQHFCEYIDSKQQSAYLETDKADNVVLYQQFGFEITSTCNLLGNVNWFMFRSQKRNI